MKIYWEYRETLVEKKHYVDFKQICFGHVRHLSKYCKFNGLAVHYMYVLLRVKKSKIFHKIRFYVNDKLA